MRHRIGFLVLALLGLTAIPGLASAQQTPSSITADVEELDGSGVMGTAVLSAVGNGTEVEIDLTGLEAAATYSVRLHAGTCTSPSASAAALPDFVANAGGAASVEGEALSQGTESVPLSTFLGGHVLLISSASGPVACATLPTVATPPDDEVNPAVLPEAVGQAVVEAAAARAGVSTAEVDVLRYAPVTWNNGCLGAAMPGEFCTQALVEGFAVWVAAGDDVLRYHTDAEGLNIRFAANELDAGAVLGAPLPEGATAREVLDVPLGEIAPGSEPPDETFGLFTYTGGTTEQLIAATGCPPERLRLWGPDPEGGLVPLLPGVEVETVNARWHALYAFGLPTDTALLGRCDPAS